MKRESQCEETLLLPRIAGGDEQAFKALFDLYKGRVMVYALKLSKSRYVAEEIVQETFMKLWANRMQLPEVRNMETFIFVIVRNRTLDHLRKIANESRLFNEVWHTISEQQELNGLLDAKDDMQLIEKAVRQLSPQKQRIFHLSRSQGLSHREIAEKCSLSESTVKNHIVETLRHVKFFLQQHNVVMAMLFLLFFR